MNIIKDVLQENGAVYGYHSIVMVELVTSDNTFRVTGNSWVSEAAKVGGLRHSSSFYLIVPVAGLLIVNNNIQQAILDYIITLPEWEGGVASTENGTSLEAKKQLKWDQFKAKRLALEFGGFTWDGSHFDSIPISQSRIQGAVILSLQAALAGLPYSVDWTLADNTVRTLSGTDMAQVGVALGTHVVAMHQISRALHEAVFAAQTEEELEAIVWPQPPAEEPPAEEPPITP